MYTLTLDGMITRDADGATIPPDPANRDFAEYSQWIADGGAPAVAVETPEQQRHVAKAVRAQAVAAIVVTTQAGNTFDGDETSQGRMARAIIALGAAAPGTTVNWVLADNSVIQATATELTEALALAGAAQAEIWVLA